MNPKQIYSKGLKIYFFKIHFSKFKKNQLRMDSFENFNSLDSGCFEDLDTIIEDQKESLESVQNKNNEIFELIDDLYNKILKDPEPFEKNKNFGKFFFY